MILVFILFLLTLLASTYFRLYVLNDPVLISASLGLIGTLIPFKGSQKEELQAVIFTSSFIGMTTTQYLNSYIQCIVLSLIGTLIFYSFKKYFIGTGGKLGTIAFASVVIYFFVSSIL